MRAMALATLLVAAPSSSAQDVARWRPLIDEASLRCGVPTSWIDRVMRAESAGWTTLDGRPIRSRAGAMGLMQLMPATWADMRARLHLGADPDDPRDNILAGTLYLRLLYERFGYPGLFAAYNAGPARYAAYLHGQQSLPPETTAYLRSVAGAAPSPMAPLPPSLFALRHEAPRPGAQGQSPAIAVEGQPTVFALRRGNP